MRNFTNLWKFQKFHINSNFYKKLFFNIFVKTEKTPNPHFIKFLPGREILEEGETHDFANHTQALNSPLARKLFDVN